MNIFLAACARSAVQQMLEPIDKIAPPTAIDHAFQLLAIMRNQFYQTSQAAGGPVADDITFGKAYLTRLEYRAT